MVNPLITPELPEMFVSKGPKLQEENDAYLTVVVPVDRIDSYQHKINRIKKQEAFEREKRARFDSLTRREIEIVILVARGLDSPRIADQLFISNNTVQQHRKNINRKLGIQSVVQVVEYALAFDLI